MIVQCDMAYHIGNTITKPIQRITRFKMAVSFVKKLSINVTLTLFTLNIKKTNSFTCYSFTFKT